LQNANDHPETARICGRPHRWRSRPSLSDTDD